MLLKVPYFRQIKANYDCGPVCIRMVLSYLKGRKLTAKEYEEILSKTMDGNPKNFFGTSIKKMKKTVHQLGYKFRSVYDLASVEKALKMELPVILKCKMIDEAGKPYDHYIVVTGMEKQYLHINDPYYGAPKRMRKSTLLSNESNLQWGKRQSGMMLFD